MKTEEIISQTLFKNIFFISEEKMTVKTESMAFRYQNLARKALIRNMKQDTLENIRIRYQDDRSGRFALYCELDRQIVEEATRLTRDSSSSKEIEDHFDQAAINVIAKYNK